MYYMDDVCSSIEYFSLGVQTHSNKFFFFFFFCFLICFVALFIHIFLWIFVSFVWVLNF